MVEKLDNLAVDNRIAEIGKVVTVILQHQLVVHKALEQVHQRFYNDMLALLQQGTEEEKPTETVLTTTEEELDAESAPVAIGRNSEQALPMEDTTVLMVRYSQSHLASTLSGDVGRGRVYTTLRTGCGCLLFELMRVRGAESVTLIYPKAD